MFEEVNPRHEMMKRNINLNLATGEKPVTPVDLVAKTLTDETEYAGGKTRPNAMKAMDLGTSHGYGSRSSSDAVRQMQNDAIINAQVRRAHKQPIERMVIEQADAQKNRNVVY